MNPCPKPNPNNKFCHFRIGLVTSVLGIVAAALDHPEIYLAFAILSGIITSFNLLVLCYFVYTAIKDSMDELHLPHRLVLFIYTEKRVGFGLGITRVIKQVPEQKSSQFGNRMKLVFVFARFYFAKIEHLQSTTLAHHTYPPHLVTTPKPNIYLL